MRYRTEKSFIIRQLHRIPYAIRCNIADFLCRFIKPNSSWMSNGPGRLPDLISAGYVGYIPEWDDDAHVFPVRMDQLKKWHPDRFPTEEF